MATTILTICAPTTEIPAKLYFIARRRRDWERMREMMQAAGIEVPMPPQRQLSPERLKQMEEMEDRITTSIDTTALADRKRAALFAHEG